MVNDMKPYLILIAALSISCTTDFTEKEKIVVTKEAKQMLDNYYADIKKEGLTAEFDYLDNSDEFFWVPPGYKNSISYDSVVSILKQNAPMFRSIDNSWDTLRVVPLTRGLASYTGRLRSLMTDTLGKTTEYVLVETGLLIKRKEGWKLLSGQTSILI
jgi:SnoaL-like domain